MDVCPESFHFRSSISAAALVMSRASRTRPVYIHFVEEDDLVRDLCRSGNYDQALKNINKRKLKKDPQNMYFMVCYDFKSWLTPCDDQY